MSDEPRDPASSGRRIRRIAIVAAIGLAGLALLAIAARLVVGGPIGRSALTAVLDGRSIGALGVIDLEGLSGDPLRDLRIARLAIADEEGEWLLVEDARLVWRPGALLRRTIHVERLDADLVRLTRRPSTGGGGGDGAPSWGAALDALALPRVELGEDVLGEAAVLAAEASLDADRDGAFAARLDVRRTDVPGDVLTAGATRDAQGRMEVAAELAASAGGPLARLLRLPSQDIRATAELTGDREAGEGRLDARLGGAPFLDASGSWTDGGGSASARARLAAAPELGALRERLGPSASVALDVGAGSGGRHPVTLAFASEGVELTAEGPADLAARTLPEGLALEISAPRLDALLGAGLGGLGAAEASGRLTIEGGAAFDGRIAIRDAAYGSWAADRISGDVVARYGDGAARVRVDLAAEGAGAPEALAAALGDAPQLSGDIRYDVTERTLVASELAATMSAGEATGRAAATLGGGPLEAQLDVTIVDAATLPRLTAGAAQLQLAAVRAPGQPLRIEVSGTGSNLAGPDIGDMLGASTTLDAAVALRAGGAEIVRASLRGERIHLEARGAADPDAGFDIALDAGLEGPVAAGPVEVAGEATAAARIEGSYENPRLRLEVRAGALAAGPVAVTDPRLRAEIADIRSAPSGTIQLDAETEEGPALLTAEIAYREGVMTARTISGGWAGFEVSGAASREPESLPEASFTVSGLEGRLAADLELTLEDGPARLDARATLRDQPIGGAGALTALNVSVTGPLDGLDIAAAARGVAGAPFTLQANGRLERSDGATRLALTPRGMLGEDAIRAPRPWTVELAGGEVHADIALEAGGGRLAAQLDRQDGRTALTGELADAPLSLLNFVRPDPRLEGRASAQVELGGTETLEGRSRLEIAGARAPDYSTDGRLDASLTLDHAASGAEVALTAQGEGGFRASADGRAPLTIAAWPPLPRIDRTAPVSLSGEASGGIAPFWALVGLPVIALDGQVDVQGSLMGTLSEPAFEGSASVSGGRLEEARVGLVLTDIEAVARLEGPRLVIERAEATDGQGGRATASGQVEFGGEPGSETEIRLDLASLRAVNASDNTAVASGDVTFSRDARGARLAGDLTIERAELSPPQGGAGAAQVPRLDVVEVNRPEDLAPPPAPRRRAMELALQLMADRQVFIRSNSLDTEWSFDLGVGGTTQDPTLEGTATLVRGDIVVVGERFELQSGTITFDGDVSDAELDFAARHETADLTVNVRVTGTPEAPEIALESTPSYPQDEILSRMLFGSATSDLSPLEAAQLANALASLTGGGGGGLDILGPLRQTLGIDRLRVGGAEGGGALVSGGAYLAEDVYLEVSSSATGLAEASIEWEIRPRLELASSFGLGRDSTISLRWRKDY